MPTTDMSADVVAYWRLYVKPMALAESMSVVPLLSLPADMSLFDGDILVLQQPQPSFAEAPSGTASHAPSMMGVFTRWQRFKMWK